MNEFRPTILVIEPDRPTFELYNRSLGREFQVIHAASEQQASVFLGQDAIEGVILEPAGLGEKGWALLAAIKSRSASRRLPVILCSSLDERQRGLEMGAAVYLLKPVLPTVLLQTLHRVIKS